MSVDHGFMRRGFSNKHYPVLFLALFVTACSSTVKAPVTGPTGQGVSAYSTRNRIHNPGYHYVKHGETLYSIAWRYGMDFKDVASWNAIKPPYLIYPGQKLRLKARPRSKPTSDNGSRKKRPGRPADKKKPPITTAATKSRSAVPVKTVNWRWPTAGKIVKLNLPTSENGLNISGKIGQEIKAAASGEVVYSGSGLLGYGKLIIIKHSDTYLSAYAHNDRILIKEGMKVTSGQKIATMGIGNNGKPLLHFEIRKNGKPVDPIHYLPPHRS